MTPKVITFRDHFWDHFRDHLRDHWWDPNPGLIRRFGSTSRFEAIPKVIPEVTPKVVPKVIQKAG